MLGLLLGEAATRPVRQRIVDVAQGSEAVDRVLTLGTMHVGPQELLVALDVLFRDDMYTDAIERANDDIEGAIRAAVPDARAIFIEPETPTTRASRDAERLAAR